MITSSAMGLSEARRLMHEWTASTALRVHMECVSACMDAYATRLDPEHREAWAVAGLLHDFDYEKHPSHEEHPVVGVAHLRTLGVPENICTAILGHADRTGVPRQTPMAKALFAVDELAGFIVACSKVRPDGLATLESSSVRKKLKDKSFAAAVSRDDIARGAADLAPLCGADPAAFMDQHVAACIAAIRGSGASNTGTAA